MRAYNDAMEVASEIVIAWRFGTARVRKMLIAAISLILAAIIMAGLSPAAPEQYRSWLEGAAGAFGGSAALLGLGVLGFQRSLDSIKERKRIERAEQRVEEDPHATQAAWDLARIKLESYLDRNLMQVRSIFWLTVLVMMIGFSFVGIGVYKIHDDQDGLNASIVTACSGILINFIGATFLVIYRATMAQARDYVNVLERINAVGMSVQILETLAQDDELRSKTTAEVAKQLLQLYAKS